MKTIISRTSKAFLILLTFVCAFGFFFTNKAFASWDWKASFKKASMTDFQVERQNKSLEPFFSFKKGKISVYHSQNNNIKDYKEIFSFNKRNKQQQELQLKKLKINFPVLSTKKTITNQEIPYLLDFFNQEYKEITKEEIIYTDCDIAPNSQKGISYIICLIGKDNFTLNKLNQIISVSLSNENRSNYDIAPIDRTKITSDSWNNEKEAINSNSQSLLEISTNTYSYRILPNRIVESQNNNDYIFYPFNSVTFDLIPNGVPSFKDNGNQVNYYTISNVVFSEE